PIAPPSKPKRQRINEEQASLEIQFQSELNDPHCRAQTADLAHARRVRNHGCRAHKAQVVRLSEEWSVQRVKQLDVKLQLKPLRDVEVLERGGIQIALTGRHKNISSRAAIVA